MREELRVCRIEMNGAAFLDTGTVSKMLVNVSPVVSWDRTLSSLRNSQRMRNLLCLEVREYYCKEMSHKL